MNGSPVNAQQVAVDLVLASVFAAPLEHGLTSDEILQVAEKLGVPQGRMKDGINQAFVAQWIRFDEARRGRYVITDQIAQQQTWFHVRFADDPRRPEAFDAIYKYLRDLADQVTAANAVVTRDVLVAHASASAAEHDVQVAIELLLRGDQLESQNDQLKLRYPNAEFFSRAAEFRKATTITSQRQFPLTNLIPLVADVIRRRETGRASHPEPLAEFERRLKAMGKDYLSDWWRFVRNELALLNEQLTPTAAITHCAALAECSLAAMVDKGRSVKGCLSERLSDDPKDWRFQHLVNAAKAGVPPIIKDQALADRCMKLNVTRQRIHAGRLIAEPGNYPRPDARPEEVRDARATTELLVRAVLDWLDAVDKPAS